MTSALRSLANTEFWSTPISKSRPVSDLNRVTRGGENCKAAAQQQSAFGTQQSVRFCLPISAIFGNFGILCNCPIRAYPRASAVKPSLSDHGDYPIFSILRFLCSSVFQRFFVFQISAIFGNFGIPGNCPIRGKASLFPVQLSVISVHQR